MTTSENRLDARLERGKINIGMAAILAVMLSRGAAYANSSPLAYDIKPRLFGADVGIGYRGLSLVPGAQTTLWIYGGGGYQTQHYYRDAAGEFLSPGDLGSGGVLSGEDASWNRIEGAWRLGIEQGLLWNPRTSTNLLEAFLFYRGRYDLNQTSSSATLLLPTRDVLPDRDSSFQNTLQLVLGYDDILTDNPRGIRDGTAAEASVEWAPSFLLNTIQGDADFVRLNGNFRWLHALYAADPAVRVGLIGLCLGNYVTADYAVALNSTRVPLSIRQSFGGRDQKVGLGQQVRGVDDGAYDANLKAADNFELRANLLRIAAPEFLPGKEIALEGVVGILAYFDAGVFDQVGEPGISSPSPGLLCATGAGVYGLVPGAGGLVLYVTYRLDRPNAIGDRLGFRFDFSWKF